MDKRLFRLLLLFSLLSFGGALILYPRLPQRVPVHWNMFGEVDGWGSPLILLFFGALPLLLLVILRALPVLDPRGRNYQRSPRAFNAIAGVTVGSLLLFAWMFLLPAMGLVLPVERAMFGAVGLLFIIIGNFMPQLPPNFFMGVRTPWALSSDAVWRKTHRFSGLLFCIAGVLFIVAFFLPAGPWQYIPVGFLLLATAASWVYSYLAYRKLKPPAPQNLSNNHRTST